MLVLSVLIIFIMIGTVNAADETSNETISTSVDDVDTLSQETDSVDEKISTAENMSNVLGSGEETFAQLQSKISNLNDGDTIKLTQDYDAAGASTIPMNVKYYGTNGVEYTNNFSPLLLITKNNIVIDGDGHTIHNTTGKLLFGVASNQNVTLKNFHFDYSDQVGSFAIFSDSQYGKIINVNVSRYSDPVRVNGLFIFHDLSSHGLVDKCNVFNGTGRAVFTRGHGPNAAKIDGQWVLPTENITVSNSNFENISVGYRGGAIEFNAFNSLAQNCTFKNITVLRNNYGGAVDFYMSAINSNLTNCTFIECYCMYGGAVAIESQQCTGIGISGCTFINNRADNGGAIYFNAADSIITNCTFDKNTASDNGGAVFFNGKNCNLEYCNFTNNTAVEGGAVKFNANNGYMRFCNYTNNTASLDGGALCSNAEGSTVEKCNFEGNNAPQGPDFYAHGYMPITFIGLKFPTLYLTNNNTQYSVTEGYGTSYQRPAGWRDDELFLETFLDTSKGKYTVYLVGNITSLPEKLLSIPNLEIIGYDPVNNPVGATLNMSGWNHRAFTVMADNIKFTNITFKNSNITGDTSNPNGGVIYITKDNTVIDGCSFYNNSAVNGSCIIMVSGDILTVMNSTFSGNNASYGGAIYINNCTNQSMIYTSTFKDNVAYLGAGIYYNETLWYTEEDNTYTGNKITNTDSQMIEDYTDIYDLKANRTYRIVYVKIGGDGIGNEPDHPTTFAKGFDMVAPRGQIIFVENGETLKFPGLSRSNAKFGVAFIGNNTTLEGITFNNLPQGYDVNISGFHFVNNDSCVIWQGRNGNIVNCTFTSKDEAALILRGEANGVDITNSSFINNTNRALTIETSDVVLDNCTFKNNTVTNGMGSHILMTNNATNIIVKDSRFIEGNKTGILVNASNVKIINSNFTDNIGENGGAIQQINGTLTLKNNNFINNTATVNGGAFNLVNGTSSLNDNNFINNTANNDGGAVYNNATLIIDGGSFTGNNASNGGAVYNNAALNINNAVFNMNNATLGGALYLNNSASIKDSSFEGNTAVNGSAIYLTKDNRLELDNVVLKDNTYTEPNDETYGSIYLNNPINEVLTYKNLNLVDKNDIYDGNYHLNTIYISSNGDSTAWGRDSSEATTLDNAVKHILDNGKIIVTDDSGDFTLNQTFNNLTNVTIIGNNKKFNKNPDNKYLFNPLKKH